MHDLDVIDDPAVATLALDPLKARILAALATPGSAASLAAPLGLPRQKINYHLRALEEAGLVIPAGERAWGGLTERLVVATAAAYVVSPAALGPVAADPAHATDQLSASYLIALAARLIREVAGLWRLARAREQRLATLSLDAVISFATPADRAAFTQDLSRAVQDLAARYHDERAPGARPFRLVVASYPAPSPERTDGPCP